MFINNLKNKFLSGKLILIIYLMSAFILLLAIIGDNGYIEYSLIQEDILHVQQQLEKLQSKKQIFVTTLHAMKQDRSIYEDIARKKLGLVKEDETIIVLKYVE